MKTFMGYTIKTLLITFAFTITYIWGFIISKNINYPWGAIIINILFAIYASCILACERNGRIKNGKDSRLLALSTAAAPLAVSIIDALFELPNVKSQFDVAKALTFLIGTFASWLVLTCIAAILFKLFDKK
ncbi:MAG: hypothetical protein LKK36_06195 [Ewingella americana]|uniref:hypothetical protein n=1 Tax=Ewingella americana TaxID=41202 RepID=UPI00242A615A|nr:hypothetical protein [Ewingella americana]MCI1676624.1 hypothetical protein [Ewingella americana]MCI1853786.1 hypothetical protein [Ewingella americana]MCI1859973.1 hypothetical protein [Ewingella americana]MCI2142301.1 hypothetical protein [Ewingella americana]MCI2163264.1 hypothetical protein [Ewingella americana]